MCKKYRANNIRNISANMFDAENRPSKSQIMWVNSWRHEEIIRNIMTKNGA